jgi:hypothetical protein
MSLVRRLRPLEEAECYARCYGTREHQVSVQVVRLDRRRRREYRGPSGEQLRRGFERLMASRAGG